MTTNRKLIVAGVWLGLAATLAAQAPRDRGGSKDHPLVSRYPGSFITRYTTSEYDEFILALGKMRGDYRMEKTERLEGKITRIVYEGPIGRSSLEILRNYESALRGAGFEPLFSCAGEACGRGSFKFYSDRTDGWGAADQRHLSAKLSRPEGDAYVSLYVRTSQRQEGMLPIVALDIIEMKPMEAGLVTVDAAALAGDLARTGHVAVYGIYFDTGKADVKPESEPALKEIATLLQQNTQLKLYVIGHTDSTGELAMNMDLSRRRAQAVVQALTTKHGIAAARLRPDGVGPYTPVASNDTEDGRAKNRRVELVKQ